MLLAKDVTARLVLLVVQARALGLGDDTVGLCAAFGLVDVRLLLFEAASFALGQLARRDTLVDALFPGWLAACRCPASPPTQRRQPARS
jgi:hypothetical protein